MSSRKDILMDYENTKSHHLRLTERVLKQSKINYYNTNVFPFIFNISNIDDLLYDEHFSPLVCFEGSNNSLNKIISDLKETFPTKGIQSLSFTFKLHHHQNYDQFIVFVLTVRQMTENEIVLSIHYTKINITIPKVYDVYFMERKYNLRHKTKIAEIPYHVERSLYPEEIKLVKSFLFNITSSLILFIH